MPSLQAERRLMEVQGRQGSSRNAGAAAEQRGGDPCRKSFACARFVEDWDKGFASTLALFILSLFWVLFSLQTFELVGFILDSVLFLLLLIVLMYFCENLKRWHCDGLHTDTIGPENILESISSVLCLSVIHFSFFKQKGLIFLSKPKDGLHRPWAVTSFVLPR